MDVANPAEIAGYRIESELARGGMGVVYLAHQSFPDRRVALKLLSPELAADPDFRERFVRESNAAASTEHPNIVPIYGAGEADGRLYLAMRFIDGTDLGTLIRRDGPLDPEHAAAICRQVAAALDAAHARGLVHRDVKPGNILIDTSGNAYLTDFGLITRSEVETGLTKTGQFMGSIAYCAPEQIKGDDVDGRTDVYSLGCVLYESLTGEPPFPRQSEAATLYAHLEEAPPKPTSRRSDIPAAHDTVVAKAMAKRPDDRYASARDLAVAAGAALGPPAAAMPGRRRRALVWGVAGVAVVLAVGIVLAFLVAGGDGGTEHPAGQPGVVLRHGLLGIDPATHEVSTKVPGQLGFPQFGQAPTLVAGEGGLWTVDLAGLVRVDAATHEIREIDLGLSGRACTITVVGVGPGAVWVLCYQFDRVLKVDPFTSRVKEVPTGLPAGSFGPISGQGVVVGRASVWVAVGDGSIRSIDPISGRVVGEVPGVTSDLIALGEGALWVVDRLGSTVTPVDLDTGDPEEPIAVSGNIDAIATGQGGLWLLDSAGGTVTEIEAETRTAQAPIGVGPGGSAIAAGFGSIWVTKPADETIVRIDPVTRDIETIDVHASAVGITPDPQSGKLWLVVEPPPNPVGGNI